MGSRPPLGASPLLSIVVPVRDEEASLELLLLELDAALAGVAGRVEFIFVDDDSRDGSLALLRELRRKDPRVRVLALDRHEGQSGALNAGFRVARGDVIVTLDADLQNDPADIPILLEALEAGADVANGVRIQRRDTLWRRFVSRVANAIRNALTRQSVTDVGCSLRAMRAPFVRRLKLYRGLHRFLPTLLELEGARVVEVPVRHRPRRYGQSKYGVVSRAIEGAVDLLAVCWMQRRTLRSRASELSPSDDAAAD